MKKIWFFLIIVPLITTACLSTSTGVIKDNYDKFSGNRSLTGYLNFSDATTQCELRFHYNVTNKEYNISYYIWDTKWLFLDTIYFIYDGDRTSYKSIKENREVLSDGDITETVYFETDENFLKNLANSNTIEFKVSGEKRNREYTFSAKHKKALQNFVRTINAL